MSLRLALELLDDMSTQDVAEVYLRARRKLERAGIFEAVRKVDTDELEPRRTWPSPDTVPAPHNPEDDGG